MTSEEAKAIRDQLGGTKAMAELLEVSDRMVRYWCQDGVKRRSTAKLVRALVEKPEQASQAGGQ